MKKFIFLFSILLINIGGYAQKSDHLLYRVNFGIGYSSSTPTEFQYSNLSFNFTLVNFYLELQFTPKKYSPPITNPLQEKYINIACGWEIPFRDAPSQSYFSITPKIGIVTTAKKPYRDFQCGLNLNYTHKWITVSLLNNYYHKRWATGISLACNIWSK